MKKLLPKLLLLFSLSLLFYLSGCEQSTEPKPENTYYSISKHVVQLDKETRQNIQSIDSNGTIIFNKTADNIKSLQAGKIIACDPQDNIPYGFLKKVISVSSSGNQVKVLTKDATIEESFENLSINKKIKLTYDDIESIPSFQEGISLEKSTDDGVFLRMIEVTFYDDGNGNTVKGNGELKIEPAFEISLDVVDYQLEKFMFLSTTVETADLRLTASASVGDDFSEELEPITFKPITIWVGWFPIVIQPKLTIQVGATINANVVFTTGLIQQATLKAGLEYNNGEWAAIDDFSKSFTPYYPQLTASLNAYGYTGPKLSLLFYGSAGPYTTLQGFMDLKANLNATPWWQLYGGAKVGVGVEVLFLGESIADYYKDDVISYRELIRQADNPIQGTITGIVKDGATNSSLYDVEVNAWKNNTIISSSVTSSDGSYQFDVDAGILDSVRFELNGYLPATYSSVVVTGFNTTYLEPILQIDESYSGLGSISGQISNALTGYGVSDLSVKIRYGINNTSGTIISSITTNSEGFYGFDNIPAGNYTIEASGTAFNTSYFSVICLGGQLTDNQNGTITPLISDSETRIILSWGNNPKDIDSHLTGPSLDNDRFHIYFPDIYKNYNYNGVQYATLDRDDTDYYGPETITILKQINGLYRYSVHDYTNREYSYSTSLSESNAQVQVYRGSELVKVFYVPANQEGTLWTVFEMTGDIITPKNIMSYTTSPSYIQKRRSNEETDGDLISKVPEK